MSVTSQVVRTVTALGNGSNTNHTIGFPFQDNDHIEVWVEDQSVTPYTLTQLVYGAGAGKFTITGGDPGTTVVMGTALSTTKRAVIQRVTPKKQTVDYQGTLAFPADDHEEQMDREVMMFLELYDKFGRCLQFWHTSSINPFFPSNSAAGLLLRINDTHDGLDYGPSLDEFDADVAAAAASAAAALVSEGAAAASAANAATSAAAAVLSAAAAALSAANAAASEAAAALSAAAAAAAVATAIGTPYEEAPTNIDNTNFTAAHTPLAAFHKRVFRNGVRQIKTTHYTWTGTAIALVDALDPLTEDLYVEYHY